MAKSDACDETRSPKKKKKKRRRSGSDKSFGSDTSPSPGSAEAVSPSEKSVSDTSCSKKSPTNQPSPYKSRKVAKGKSSCFVKG